MTHRRSLAWLAVGVLVAGSSLLFVSLSIGRIRAGVWFNRALDRIEHDGATDAHLTEAAAHARRPAEWRRLVQITWKLEEDRRWVNTAELSLLAADRFRRDDMWNLLAAYALIRSGRYDRAVTVLEDVDSPSETSQMMEVLVQLNPAARAEWPDRLGALSSRGENQTMLRAVGRAVRSGDAEDLYHAGVATGVPAFYINSAVAAARLGRRDTAVRAVEVVKKEFFREDILEDRNGTDAAVHLAAWLRDSEWFFSLLRTLGGRRAVEPDVLAMQGDFLVEQRQYNQALEVYRELRRLHPESTPVAFVNSAAILRLRDEPGSDEIYREGIRYHPSNIDIPMEYAAFLAGENRRLDAIQVLIRVADQGTHPPDGRRWLLIRAVLGPRRPVERLEADAWNYLNEHPDEYDVARFLAGIFLVRRDSRGLQNLLRRYPPETGDWAQTIHAIAAADRGDYARADNLFSNSSSLSGLYNYGLFSLRHRELFKADQVIEKGLNQAGFTDDPIWKARLFLLQAENLRLTGRHEEALEFTDAALRLTPDNDTVYTYRTRLARQP